MFKNNDRKFKGKSTLTKQGFSLPKEINGLYLFVVEICSQVLNNVYL